MTPKKTKAKATFSRLFKKWGRSHFTCPSLTYVNTPMNAVPFKTLHRDFKCICFDGSLFANPYIVTHSMHPRNILNYHDIFFVILLMLNVHAGLYVFVRAKDVNSENCCHIL